MAIMYIKQCKQCQVSHEAKLDRSFFCSKNCGQKWHNGRRPLSSGIATCETCQSNFKSSRKTSKHCSKKCENQWRAKKLATLSGEKLLREQELRRGRYARMRADENRKLKVDLRCRLNRVISGDTKTGSAVNNLGCTIEELKKHLESKFYPNTETGEVMSWGNRGLHGWHIDHVKPLVLFDLSNLQQLKDACNYKNLQPLWAKDNLEKKDRYVIHAP